MKERWTPHHLLQRTKPRMDAPASQGEDWAGEKRVPQDDDTSKKMVHQDETEQDMYIRYVSGI